MSHLYHLFQILICSIKYNIYMVAEKFVSNNK